MLLSASLLFFLGLCLWQGATRVVMNVLLNNALTARSPWVTTSSLVASFRQWCSSRRWPASFLVPLEMPLPL